MVQVIGEGYHPKAGEPHAEVFALRAAGEDKHAHCSFLAHLCRFAGMGVSDIFVDLIYV